MKKEKLYEATYVIYDGEHEYLIKDRYWAETQAEALGQFVSEMNECYNVNLAAEPFQRVEMPYDWRELELMSMEYILGVDKLERACQFALRYIDNLPLLPMWNRDNAARVAVRKVLVAALEE